MAIALGTNVGSPTMTTFTVRYVKGHFIVTGPDIPPMQFESRVDARSWYKANYPGSPIAEIGRDQSRRVLVRAKGPRKGSVEEDWR